MSKQRKMRRRTFIKAAGAVAVGVAFLDTTGCVPAGPGLPAHLRFVFRLSTRGTRTCNACKSHAANWRFISENVAAANRAHLGCNCHIVQEVINQNIFNMYFSPPSGPRTLVDLRHV